MKPLLALLLLCAPAVASVRAPFRASLVTTYRQDPYWLLDEIAERVNYCDAPIPKPLKHECDPPQVPTPACAEACTAAFDNAMSLAYEAACDEQDKAKESKKMCLRMGLAAYVECMAVATTPEAQTACANSFEDWSDLCYAILGQELDRIDKGVKDKKSNADGAYFDCMENCCQ
jgi:hypothetical protein